MRRPVALFSAVQVCLGLGLFVLTPPAQAAPSPIWDVTDVLTTEASLPGAGATITLTATCPAGQTPIAGGYYPTLGNNGDVRRLAEHTNWGDGAAYQVSLVNLGDGVFVQADALCVSLGYFTDEVTKGVAFAVGADHFASGSVGCDSGYSALSAYVDWTNAGGTLYTSTTDLEFDGWYAKGYDTVLGPSSSMVVYLHCVPTSDIPGARIYQDSDPATTRNAASAYCPAGLRPISGGTYHDGGDGTGITFEPHFTTDGLVSEVESPSGGTVYTNLVCIATDEPQIDIPPGQPYPQPNSTSGVWTFSATDPAAAGDYGPITFRCRFDHDVNGVLENVYMDQSCSSPWQIDGLTDGSWVLTPHAYTSDGRTTYASEYVFIDTTAPTITQTAPTAHFTSDTAAKVSWSTKDVSDIGSWGVRWQRASKHSGFGSWSVPAHVPGGVPGTTTSRSFRSLSRGYTYCFSVRGTDARGNTSAWTTSHCTAIPLDDRDLAASSGWAKVAPRGYLRHTALTTKHQGAALSITRVTLKRVAVVARTCPTCGVVGVYVGSTKVGRIDLHASKTARRVISLRAFSLRTGTVKLKVLSAGKLVQIDGLGVSRT